MTQRRLSTNLDYLYVHVFFFRIRIDTLGYSKASIDLKAVFIC